MDSFSVLRHDVLRRCISCCQALTASRMLQLTVSVGIFTPLAANALATADTTQRERISLYHSTMSNVSVCLRVKMASAAELHVPL